MGTESLPVTKEWVELIPEGVLIGVQNWSSCDIDIVFALEAPLLTDTGVMVAPGSTLDTIPSGRLFARMAIVSPYLTGKLVLLTGDAPAPA